MKCAFNKIMHGAVLLSALAVVGSAAAADGEITFVGKVTSATCKINNNAPNFQVVLPTVSAQTLNGAGKVAGRTPFKISLSDCTTGLKTVGVHFEHGSNTHMANNRLINNATANSNVEIQLLNENFSMIKLGEAYDKQEGQIVNINNGNAILNYFAEYYSTGMAKSGDVKSSTMYSITYP